MGREVPGGWIPSGYHENQVGMALGDVDRDGELELVISYSIMDFGTVAPSPTFLMNMQGEILPGWPLETYYLSRPTIVDLDLDGQCEIVFMHNNLERLRVYRMDGTLYPGFLPGYMGNVLAYYSAADTIGDRRPELITTREKVRVWHPTGELAMETEDDDSITYHVVSAVKVTTPDGVEHVRYACVGTESVSGIIDPQYLYLFGENLQHVPGWPKPLDNYSFPVHKYISFLDLDGDGIPQLILRVRESGGTRLHGFDLDFEQPGEVEVLWFDLHHSAKQSRWIYHFGYPKPRFLRGDANSDGVVQISDVIAMGSQLFLGAPSECPRRADANGDCALNIADMVYLLGGLFLGAAPPPPPFPACGDDTSGCDLPCPLLLDCGP